MGMWKVPWLSKESSDTSVRLMVIGFRDSGISSIVYEESMTSLRSLVIDNNRLSGEEERDDHALNDQY